MHSLTGITVTPMYAHTHTVVLNRDMEIDFHKVECIGISQEKKESLISIYTGAPLPKGKVQGKTSFHQLSTGIKTTP